MNAPRFHFRAAIKTSDPATKKRTHWMLWLRDNFGLWLAAAGIVLLCAVRL